MYLLDLKLSYHFNKFWNTSFDIPINYFSQDKKKQKSQLWGLGDIRFAVNHLLSSSAQTSVSDLDSLIKDLCPKTIAGVYHLEA